MYPWLSPYLERHYAALAQLRFGHAWLIRSVGGCGEEQLAQALAKAYLCAQRSPTGACGFCHSCQLIAAGNHPDWQWLPLEGRTIPIDQIRTLIDKLQASAQLGGGKIAVLPGAERMSEAAANALLKTLEEPSADTLLILISHEPQRLLPTLRSRCQQITLSVPKEGETLQWLSDQQISATRSQLRICQAAPLKTLAYLESGVDQARRPLLQKVIHLGRRPEFLSEIITQWEKMNTEVTLWLVLLLGDALKLQAGVNERHLAMSDLHALSEELAAERSCEWLLDISAQLLALQPKLDPSKLYHRPLHRYNWLSHWL